jgi:hypothetical protein
VDQIEVRIARLEKRMASLEGERPGRKRIPIIVSIEGVCGLDPNRDSSTCPDGSLYRRQNGCLGVACKAAASDYYNKYRKMTAAKKKTRVAKKASTE